MSPNLDLKQGIFYLERERGREIKETDRKIRKIEGRGSETDDNKNPKQSWVAQLVLNKTIITAPLRPASSYHCYNAAR